MAEGYKRGGGWRKEWERLRRSRCHISAEKKSQNWMSGHLHQTGASLGGEGGP